MNVAETGKLLALIRVGDNRQVDQATIAAWHDVVSDLPLADALEAVRQHRRTSTEYLMPAHVRAGVHAMRVERLRVTPAPCPLAPPDDVAAYVAQRRALVEAIASGRVAPGDAPAMERLRAAVARQQVGAAHPRKIGA